MQIKRITASPVRYPETNDYNNLRHLTLVKVESDDGLTGWGECVAMWPEVARAVKPLIEDGLAPQIIGRDPRDNEAIHATLRDYMWWYGDTGMAMFALSAIDIALWDLKGKALGVPLYQLLGGKVHDHLRVCASTHPSKASLDDLAAELAAHAANGYTAVKVGFGKTGEANLGVDPQRDIAYVKTVREAIGPDVEFMVDLGKKTRWDSNLAIRMIREFERYNVRWIEDPLPHGPASTEGYRRLRGATHTPISMGEREWTVAGYKRLIEQNIGDIFMVDPGRVEGVTGVRRVIDLLEASNLIFNAHTWSSAINTAASIHLTASTPNYLVLEMKPVRSPMQHELVCQPIEQSGGYVAVSDAPGLGIEINESVVQKYLFG